MRTVYIIALLAWAFGSSYYCKNQFCPDDSKAKPSATAITNGAAAAKGGCDKSLLFADGNFEASSASNFIFGANSFRLKAAPSDVMQKILVKVADYLNENPNKTLQFDGLYFEKEKNTSTEDNLGLARSATIKSYLVKEFGIDESQLILGSQMTTNACYDKEKKIINKGATATFGVSE